MSALDVLKQIWQIIVNAFSNDVLDVETFFVEAAKYAAQNIKAAVLKAVADAMTAAEAAFASDASVDRYALAFSNAVAALEKDGIEFVESDINYAVEAVIQQRNQRTAATEAPLSSSDPAPAA